jgi:methyltransferase
MMLVSIAVIVVIAQRVGELALARRNFNRAMRCGGKEFGANHYWLFWALHLGWLVSFTLECLIRQPPVSSLWPLLLFLAIFAQVLRYWAILSLGHCWNTRIVVFDGMSRVKSGPYRYFKHPNYLAVALELMVIPALLGAWYSALAFSIANAALLLFVRIPAEEQAMRKCLRDNRSSSSKMLDG